MKKSQGFLAILLMSLCFQGIALAKIFEGKANTADVKGGNLEMTYRNPVTNADEKIAVALDAKTIYTGIASADALKGGDRVSVEADQDVLSGKWVASSVEVLTF